MSYKATKFQAFYLKKSAARLCFFENFPMQMNLVVKIKLDGGGAAFEIFFRYESNPQLLQ